MAKKIVFKSYVKKANGIALSAWESGLRAIKGEVKAAVQAQIGTPYPPASKPLQPPHRRSGRLQRGITTVVEKGTRGRAAALVIKADRDYAEYLLSGTSKMAPRPFGKQVLTGSRRSDKISQKWIDKVAAAAVQKTKSKARKRGRK